MGVLNRASQMMFYFRILGMLLIFCSCSDDCCEESDCLFVDAPENCQKSNHKEGEVRFLVQLDSLNPLVKIIVYKGPIENNAVQIPATEQSAYGPQHTLANGEYTVAAIYKTDTTDDVVIKSFEVKPELVSETDCYDCYAPYNESIDLWRDPDAKPGE